MIRVVLSADLHYHSRSRRAVEHLAQQVALERPDCLILAGDTGYPFANFRQGLAVFRGLRCPKLALAGNHDVWSDEHDSRALWERELGAAAAEAGFVWLDRGNFRLGSLGICGTIGWYDYSARDASLVLDDRDYFINKGMFNNDGNYVDWAWTDRQFAGQVLDEFSARLAALCGDPAITQVLVATHVPPFAENVVHKLGDFAWTMCNAYTANLTLGQAIVHCAKVTHVVSGHTHAGGQWAITTPYGLVESHVVGSDYGLPAYIVIEFPWIIA